MATSITRGSANDTFIYNSEHSRAKEVATSSSGTVTTVYVSPSFEVVSNTATGTTEYHNYVNSSTRRVAMLIDSTASTTAWRYFHQDQIGSTDAVTDQTGAIVERLSYEAFGRRRNTNGTDSTTFIQAQDSYGYTDQEELDSIGLVNMNGRIYDPTIGRFLSADPTIARPFDLQGHNRYAYVSNRPFVSIDPTGFVRINLAAALVEEGASFFGSEDTVGGMSSYQSSPTPIFDDSGNVTSYSTSNGVIPAGPYTSNYFAPDVAPTGGGTNGAAASAPVNGGDVTGGGTGQPAGDTGSQASQDGSTAGNPDAAALYSNQGYAGYSKMPQIAAVGGFGDGGVLTTVVSSTAVAGIQAANPSANVNYFNWDEGDALSSWMSANPDGTVVGHSLGASTAIMTAMNNPDFEGTLMTVDGVGGGIPGQNNGVLKGNNPINFANLSPSINWINITATGGGILDESNLVRQSAAFIGPGAWGTTVGNLPNTNFSVTYDHGGAGAYCYPGSRNCY